jgi:hypothetical protein
MVRQQTNGIEGIVADIRYFFMKEESPNYCPDCAVPAKRGFTKYWLTDISGFYTMAYRHRYYLNNPATKYTENARRTG